MCRAFASIARNTGSSSPGELEITRSTSDVAVCCSSDSVRSRVRACTSSNSRTFSIAITAWSANVVITSTCLSVNGVVTERASTSAPMVCFPEQRNREHGAKASSFLGLSPGVFGISQDIGDLDNPPFQQGPPHHGPSACFNRDGLQVVIGVGGDAIARRVVIRAGVLLAHNRGHLRLAKSCRRLCQRIEHRLEIETRAANDLKYVSGGRLLLQRFAQFVEQPRILDGDHGLVGEILYQVDLFVGERPHLLTKNED